MRKCKLCGHTDSGFYPTACPTKFDKTDVSHEWFVMDMEKQFNDVDRLFKRIETLEIRVAILEAVKNG